MATQGIRTVSEKALRRLPSYLRVLKRLRAQGRDVASTTHIATELGLDPTQVRKDIASTGIVGKPKVGYGIDELVESIEGLLNWNNTTEAFVVGAGDLGRALLGYRGFAGQGLNLVAAFDNDENRVGRQIHGKEVMPMSKLANLAERMKINMAVLTVPEEAAQQAADEIIDAGIIAIWNFTPAALSVPESVIVQNVDLSSDLAVLSARLAERLAERGDNE